MEKKIKLKKYVKKKQFIIIKNIKEKNYQKYIIQTKMN